MIYSFYDPEHEVRTGLGNFIILDHIRRAVEAGLPYVYLGYWVDGSARMQYKIRYRPLEKLGSNGWERFDSAEQDELIAKAVASPRDAVCPVDGSSKDGVPGTKDQYQF